MAKKLFLFLLGLTVLSSFSFVPVKCGDKPEKKKSLCSVIFWSRCAEKYFVSIDGKYIGMLDRYYTAETQHLDCGDPSGVNVRLKRGKHKVMYQNSYGRKNIYVINVPEDETITCFTHSIDC